MPARRKRQPRGTTADGAVLRVCVVGGGPRFLSGISYYTHRLICELAVRHPTCAILARQIVPRRLYPGASRVGSRLTEFRYPDGVDVIEGLDWYWGLRIMRSMRFILRQRPQVVILQWWTGALLHTYLLLAVVARLVGARIVLEFHEVQDVGEVALPLARVYVDALMPVLVRLTDAAVIHSEFDREPVTRRHHLKDRPIAVISHGPFDQHRDVADPSPPSPSPGFVPFSLLYFGVIRPFKGVEDLISAFDSLDERDASRFTLTVVGETWEKWTLPAELIASSRRRERITFVNRYVSDEEVSGFFRRADAVVLPYHRSSASGPLHLAMSTGLPVIVSEVGGLVEAARDYEGAVFVPPNNPEAIREALLDVVDRRGVQYPDPHSWVQTVDRFEELFDTLGLGDGTQRSVSPLAGGSR